MNVKAVVKVMNFHALLRVEKSGKQAIMYSTMEDELSAMMQILQSNRNLRLDKHIRLPDPDLPVLLGKTDSFVSPRKDKIRNNGCDDRCNNNKCQYDQNKK